VDLIFKLEVSRLKSGPEKKSLTTSGEKQPGTGIKRKLPLKAQGRRLKVKKKASGTRW